MRHCYTCILVVLLSSFPSEVQSQDCRTHLANLQQEIIDRFPSTVASMGQALSDTNSPLSGYFLGHGDVILAGMGLTLGQFEDPSKPNLLFYWPTDSSPSEWLDFTGPDDPIVW